MKHSSAKPAARTGFFSRQEKRGIAWTVGVFALAMVAVAVFGNWADLAAAIEKATAGKVYAARFRLPPIVVQLPAGAKPARSLVISSALEFDGDSLRQVRERVRLASQLSPRIVDSVVSGVHEMRYRIAADTAVADRVILARSNAILEPYGAAASCLSSQHNGPR